MSSPRLTSRGQPSPTDLLTQNHSWSRGCAQSLDALCLEVRFVSGLCREAGRGPGGPDELGDEGPVVPLPELPFYNPHAEEEQHQEPKGPLNVFNYVTRSFLGRGHPLHLGSSSPGQGARSQGGPPVWKQRWFQRPTGTFEDMPLVLGLSHCCVVPSDLSGM